MRAKPYTLKEFENILDNNGFIKARRKGSHVTYKKEDKMITIVACNSKGMNKMICRRLIKENGLVV